MNTIESLVYIAKNASNHHSVIGAFKISSVSLYEAFSVVEDVLKPNCSTAKILLVSKCFKSVIYNSFKDLGKSGS